MNLLFVLIAQVLSIITPPPHVTSWTAYTQACNVVCTL